MARVTVEDCLEKVDSRFSLVHLAVRRVLQLRSGGAPLLDAPKNKEIVLALREIAAGMVTPENIKQIEEAKALFVSPPREKEEEKDSELKEILDAATQYDASLEFEESDQVIEQDED